MRNLFLLILLGFFVEVIHCRPSQSEESNESQEEIEYESDGGSPAEDTLEDSHLGDEDPNGQEIDQSRRLLDLNRNTYLQKNLAEDTGTRTNIDAPDFKPTRTREIRNDRFNEENANEDFQTYGKHRQVSRYIENNDGNDQLEVAQHLTNHDVNNYKSNRLHNNMIVENPLKRTLEAKKTHTEEGDLLFGSNRDQTSKFDKNDYNEPLDLKERSTNTKQYYNQVQLDNIGEFDGNSRSSDYNINFNRDRREAKKSNQADPENHSNVETGSESFEKSDSENEEMAIRRHIKKMSGDELEQLLNSLSEEKRSLLKRIIDEGDPPEKTYDSINKREITKKSGAVEDNGYIESSQSESNKIEGGFSSIDITTSFPSPPNIDATDTTKSTDAPPDSSVLSNQKAAQEGGPGSTADLKSDNNSEKTENAANSFASNTDTNKNQAEVVANEQITSKGENKRETNVEDVVDATSFEDPKLLESNEGKEYTQESRSGVDGYFLPKDEEFLEDVEESRSFDSSKIYKREVEKQSELEAKLKSLEESFPNADAYDELAPYNGPLIRVKRKNPGQVMKKRSAAVLPDAKVGYFPNKAENNDDDNDEGNEFDDDGFYDPAPNFVNNENKNVDTNSQQTGRDDASCKLNTIDQSKTPVRDANGGTMNLGSDTDNVLSGVEGVDENLMFSSGTRNRRKTEGNVENVDGNNISQSDNPSNAKSTSSSDINIPYYQDNDSFGGFPRTYEGDLGRYKRIRRLKQSHNSEENSNA